MSKAESKGEELLGSAWSKARRKLVSKSMNEPYVNFLNVLEALTGRQLNPEKAWVSRKEPQRRDNPYIIVGAFETTHHYQGEPVLPHTPWLPQHMPQGRWILRCVNPCPFPRLQR